MIKLFSNSLIKQFTKPSFCALSKISSRNFSSSATESKETIHQGMEIQKEAESHLKKLEYKDALTKANYAYEIVEKSFGSDNVYTAEALIKMSEISNILGYYEKGFANASQAVEILKNYSQTHRPIMASALSVLSDSLANVGSYAQALAVEKEAYDIKRQMYGKNNIHTLDSRISIGDKHRLVGKFSESEAILTECLKEYDPAVENSDLRKSSPHLPLVELYLDKLDYDQAHYHLGIQLSELEKLNKKKHLLWGKVYNLLGELEVQEKSYQDAEISLQNALDFYNSTFEGMHPEASVTLTHLAKCYSETGDAEKAKTTQSNAIEIFNNFIADVTHPQYLMMNICLGIIMRKSADKIGAQKLI